MRIRHLFGWVARIRNHIGRWIVERKYALHVTQCSTILAGFKMRPIHLMGGGGFWGRIFRAIPSKLFMLPIAASLALGFHIEKPLIDIFSGVEAKQEYPFTAKILAEQYQLHGFEMNLSASATVFVVIWAFALIAWPYFKMAVPLLTSGQKFGPPMSYFTVRLSSSAIIIAVCAAAYTFASNNWGAVDAGLQSLGIERNAFIVLTLLAGLYVHNRFDKAGDVGIEELVGKGWRTFAFYVGLLMYLMALPFLINLITLRVLGS